MDGAPTINDNTWSTHLYSTNRRKLLVSYCKRCGTPFQEGEVYCPTCGCPFEIKGRMWDIYSFMLIMGFPPSANNGLMKYGSKEIQYHLKGLERIGLIRKNPQGNYEIIECRKLDALLSFLSEHIKWSNLRRVFYLSFLVTLLLLLLFYVAFSLYESLIAIHLSIMLILFSVSALVIETVIDLRFKIFIKKLILVRAKISDK